MPDFTDESFNDLIRVWPNKAIKHLYDHYYNILVHLAERKTHDRKASEDIVQDVLIEVWKKSGSLVNREGFLVGPYLINLVRKRAISFYLQASKITGDPSFPLEELLGTKASREAEIIQSDKYRTLQGIVSAMPTREREVIEMRFFHEKSIESIAQQLGISKKSVEKYITKGLKRLRDYKSSMY